MTLTAQRDVVIGALCSDEALRTAVLDSTDRTAAWAHVVKYGQEQGVDLDTQIAEDVWKLINDPDRDDFFNNCVLKFCKVWPCR